MDREGEAYGREERFRFFGKGDIIGGIGILYSGEIWLIGEVGEEGLEFDIRGEIVCEVFGGVVIKGASKGGRGGFIFCRILFSVLVE